MTALVNSIEINRPADEVFAYVVDPAKFPEWQRDVTRVSVQGDEVGSHFTTVRKIGGAERSMTQEITESVPPRTWAARGVDGPIRPNATVDIEPIAADRCRVTFGLDFDGRGMASALVPMVRRMATKVAPASHQRLKELLEGRG
ncbi:SRPBCC family protein [Actinomadura bangladeshensis]|uniref:SRPBCC family protein n=1 Tax=Actinomadura bangladeshensis TaxID=453573 RepID=A0A4V2XNV9_9ACTN|nr:SRPBCC family protein [Actinomadura bangladeshensis]TDC19726.1 SRPBCC family protein [Actinomadura bangladeshensis]